MVTPQTVAGILWHNADSTPDARFLHCGEGWLSYAETATRVDRVAAGLRRHGVRAGDRVAIVLLSETAAVLSIFACARLGAVGVSLNTFLRGEFMRYQLADCSASVVVTDLPGFEQLRPIVDELPDLREVVLVGGTGAEEFPLPVTPFAELEREAHGGSFPVVGPEDVFSILYTSGTTGMPKGCVASHRYATHVPKALCENGRFVPGDTVLTASPLFHTSGQIFAMGSALHVGGAIAFEREFHASTFIERAAEVDATVIFGVGAVGLLLLAQPKKESDRKHSVRQAVLNGMPVQSQLDLEERFGFHVVGEMYGQTEVVPVAASPVEGPRNRASGGRPLEHVEVAVVDDHDWPVEVGTVGEIVVRPRRPGVMFEGYWNNPAATLESRRNLWHHTGDYGRLDDDGFLFFVDRKKDAIRRRGEFVVAWELEGAIKKHDDVLAAAVHAIPSELTEDEIRAWLVLRPGATMEPEALFAFFKQTLPYFAIPRYVDIVGELPTNQSARVLKHELKTRPIGEQTWDLHAMGFTVRRAERRG